MRSILIRQIINAIIPSDLNFMINRSRLRTLFVSSEHLRMFKDDQIESLMDKLKITVSELLTQEIRSKIDSF